MTKLLEYVLHQYERSPDAKYYESDMTRISASGFAALKKEKYLRFDQYDFEQENYVDKRGNERFVRKVNGRWVANSIEDSEVSPLYLADGDLNRYTFNPRPLFDNIKATNNLSKNIDSVGSRIWFIGETAVLNENVGVFVAFLPDDRQAEAELLGLRAKIGKMDGILVLCPSYALRAQGLLNKLEAQRIRCLTFKETFTKKDYAINFAKLRFAAASGKSTPKLTASQTADYTKHKYLCYDTLHIPGTASRVRSNDIAVNGDTVKMPDESFRLLIELVAELKKRKGGWRTKVMLSGNYQIFDRVRKPLEGSLQGKDAKKYIENNGAKQYRISTHPDFVTYDLRNLKKHADSVVSEFAEKMPKA